MADYLDIMPVGVKNKCRIVLTAVLRTQSWRSVVLPARAQSGVIERVDLGPVFDDECYV